MGKKAALWLLMIVLLPSFAAGSGTWYSISEDSVPENFGFLVHDDDYTGTVRMTFLGDCTLGGEEAYRGSPLGFRKVIQEKGMEWPTRYLSRLTASDDLTVANLEGVLTDRKLEKVEKEFNFSGPTVYTEILTAGGIECVTLANNHSHDYGNAGYRDTVQALEESGTAWFGTDSVAVWQHESGLMIGFAGAFYSAVGNRGKMLQEQLDYLQKLGCSAIIVVMHAGKEHVLDTTGYQTQIASRAAAHGACLVVGHHPHVVQGYDLVDGIPVVYSLGNCIFGGTTYAKDSDALILQAELHFEDSELQGMTLHFYPISITSDAKYNNYSPEFLTGSDANRVLQKMEKSTGKGFDSFSEEEGATLKWERDGEDG